MKFNVRHLKWRNGRPRWEPSRHIRHAWKGRDLRDDCGQWMLLPEAMAAAEAINVEVDTWRAKGMPRRRDPVATAHPHAVSKVWDNYTASIRFTKKAAKTQAGYRKHARIVLEAIGCEPVRAITKPVMIAFYEQLITQRGLAMANATLAVASILFSHAERLGWRAEESNPAFNMGRETLPPRTVVWTPAEITRFVAVADRVGHHAIADAVVIALHTAQRLSDVLALGEPEQVGAVLRFPLVQSKRQARVSVPLSGPLAERIADLRRRRRSGQVTTLHTTGPLITRADGSAYADRDLSTFNRDFREVRRLAARGDMAHGEQPMPTLTGKQFLDLRDTAITRLALAGCTLSEIRAISGHSLATITTVLKHYIVLDEAMADGAIARLQVWMQHEGIAL